MNVFEIVVAFVCIFLLYTLAKCIYKLYTGVRTLISRDKAISQFAMEPNNWFMGHLSLIPTGHENLMRLTELVKKYPRCMGFRYTFLRPALKITHPEVLKTVIKSNTPKGVNQFGSPYHMSRPLHGDSIFLSVGAKWQRHRKLVMNAFYPDILKQYVLVYDSCADIFINTLKEASRKNGPPTADAIADKIYFYVLDVILKCLYSKDENIQTRTDNSTFMDAVMAQSEEVMDRMFKPFLYSDSLYFSSPRGKNYKKQVDIIHQYALNIIEKRRKEQALPKTEAGAKTRTDVLELLLNVRDEDGKGLTDQEIKDETTTFLIGAFDSTTTLFIFLLYSLATNPEHQQRARAEVDAIFEGKDTDAFTAADIGQLEFTTRCVKETLRMYPPFHILGRQTDSPLEIDGKSLPSGTMIDLDIWMLHHNPTVWPDPFKFDPERFLPEESKGRDNYALVPFSMGSRNCIGERFAMNKVRTFIAKILRHYEITVDAGYELRLKTTLTLMPETSIPFRFKERGRNETY